jgi:EAL domain-containing protein (putative c-di-GMP-specific phosphodiesterase class I)
MPNLIAQEQAITLAKKIIQLMQNKWSIASHELIVTCSIGIAMYPLHTASEDVLIKFADIAMYHAKERGRNNWQLFEKNMSINVKEQFTLEQDLRAAIKADDQLCAYFQPKISLATNKVVGAECLIRWHHPNGDTIFPDEFIALAENTGLILEIGQKVMRQSLQMIKAIHTKYGIEVQIAVNLSGRQFQYQGLPAMVKELLEEYDVPPHLLELEITETISMQDITKTLQILTELKNLGVDLAIDDFGTGYSSLAYLKQFPVDTLKIDKSFVMDMVEDGEDRSIVEAIILMAKAMNLSTVAEGVETPEHVQVLQYMSCDYVQGYHFYKALPPQEFDALLSKQDKSFT